MQNQQESANKQIAKGPIWTGLHKLLKKPISIISTLILARLLLPADFGLVTMTMMAVGFLELMRALGFEAALIQTRKPQRIITIPPGLFFVIANSLIAIILIATAGLVASFYNYDRLTGIMPLLATGIFISGFEIVAAINFRKKPQFHKDFQHLLMRKLFNAASVISLTFYFRNYMGLPRLRNNQKTIISNKVRLLHFYATGYKNWCIKCLFFSNA